MAGAFGWFLRRLIPAGAGNTLESKKVTHCKSAHPRGCGEHVLWPRVWDSKGGSSPRVRGTLIPNQRIPVEGRLIPAGAGNTF